MEVRHFATIMVKGNSFFPNSTTVELAKRSLKGVKIPKNAVKIITYDKVFDAKQYNNQQVVLTSKELNVRTYHIGTFVNLNNAKTKEEKDLLSALQKQGCIGIIKNASGEYPLFKFEKYIDTSLINKDGFIRDEKPQKEE